MSVRPYSNRQSQRLWLSQGLIYSYCFAFISLSLSFFIEITDGITACVSRERKDSFCNEIKSNGWCHQNINERVWQEASDKVSVFVASYKHDKVFVRDNENMTMQAICTRWLIGESSHSAEEGALQQDTKWQYWRLC